MTKVRVTAILYSQLATRPRSLAIILPIHLYLLSLESTFATVFHNYHTYDYKAERWRTCPYTIIALSVNGYVSLTGFHEFTLIPTRLIIQSTLEITALKTTYQSMITASTDIYRFIIQLSTLMGAEKSSETNSRMRRVTGDDDNIMTTDRDYSIRPMRETEYDRDIESNIIPTSQMSAISSQRSYNGRDVSPQ